MKWNRCWNRNPWWCRKAGGGVGTDSGGGTGGGGGGTGGGGNGSATSALFPCYIACFAIYACLNTRAFCIGERKSRRRPQLRWLATLSLLAFSIVYVELAYMVEQFG